MTDKPRIAILMAIYEPRMDWLREQLESLDQQTYPNLKLYIRDDASPKVRYEDICEVLGYDPDCPQMCEVGHDGVCFPLTEDLPSEIKDGPVRLFLSEVT